MKEQDLRKIIAEEISQLNEAVMSNEWHAKKKTALKKVFKLSHLMRENLHTLTDMHDVKRMDHDDIKTINEMMKMAVTISTTTERMLTRYKSK